MVAGERRDTVRAMSDTSGAEKPAHEGQTEAEKATGEGLEDSEKRDAADEQDDGEERDEGKESDDDDDDSDDSDDDSSDDDSKDDDEESDDESKPPPAEAAPPDRRIARILAVLVLIGLPALLLLLAGPDRGAKQARTSKFAVGQKFDVEITLVATDKQALACASKETVAGTHCAFEDSKTPWKGGAGDDKTLLRPYNTTAQEPLMIAGLWSEPALAGQLPAQRFSVKCSYSVDAKISKPSVRWQTNGQWIDETIEWPVGTVSRCAMVGKKP
jgi:hypothetical protein